MTIGNTNHIIEMAQENAKKKLKQKRCRQCKELFTPWNSLHVCCEPPCAIQYNKDKQETANRREIKRAEKIKRAETSKRKEKLKSRSDWLREAQQAVNKYVRLRDKGKPCVSCDKPDNGQHQRHASHFRSVGACAALRFNLKNIYASCQQCNTTHSGNILEYRIRLVKRYGEDFVRWLESQNQTVKYDIDYLKRLKIVFSKRCRILEKRL